MPDLNAVVDGLVDGLDGFELLRVDQLTVGVRTVAGAKGSAGEALCAAQGVRVAGTAVPVETCDDLAAALADADAAIADVLAALPSDLPTGRIDDLVDVTAPATRVSDTNTRADDGTYLPRLGSAVSACRSPRWT